MTMRKYVMAAVLGLSLIGSAASAGELVVISPAPGGGSDNGGAIIAVGLLAIITLMILGSRTDTEEE